MGIQKINCSHRSTKIPSNRLVHFRQCTLGHLIWFLSPRWSKLAPSWDTIDTEPNEKEVFPLSIPSKAAQEPRIGNENNNTHTEAYNSGLRVCVSTCTYKGERWAEDLGHNVGVEETGPFQRDESQTCVSRERNEILWSRLVKIRAPHFRLFTRVLFLFRGGGGPLSTCVRVKCATTLLNWTGHERKEREIGHAAQHLISEAA